MSPDDPIDIVRLGYDAASYYYRRDDAGKSRYEPWIAELCDRISAHADVLDVGCGCGVPVARALIQAGHRVTGVDVSDVQIRRAQQLMPTAAFVRADVTSMTFAPASCDAVVCLYALIHMPLRVQPALITRIATWLRPGAWLLATTGHTAWTGAEDDWLGSGARMWWSHADAPTYASWLTDAGLLVERQEFIPEGKGGHALFWAYRAR